MVTRVTENITTFPAQLIRSTRRRKTARVSVFVSRLIRLWPHSPRERAAWALRTGAGDALRIAWR